MREVPHRRRHEDRVPIDERHRPPAGEHRAARSDVAVDHHDWFNNVSLPNPAALKTSLSRLNAVRRKVAHHREISSDELKDCRDIARSCLAPIGAAHPHLIDDFLVDRWEDRAAHIVDEMRAKIDSTDAPPAGSMPDAQRRRLAIEALVAQHHAVGEALSSLNQLAVPASRQQIHDAAVKALTHWQTALSDLIATGSQPGLTVAQAQAAGDVYAGALERVHEVTEEIRQLRVSAPTE